MESSCTVHTAGKAHWDPTARQPRGDASQGSISVPSRAALIDPSGTYLEALTGEREVGGMRGSNFCCTRCRANIPRPQSEPRIRLGTRCLTKLAPSDVDPVTYLCGQENFSRPMANTGGPLPVKVAPARETPATPATPVAVRGRGGGGLQTLALEADETHPAGRTLRGSDARVPLAGRVIGPRSREIPLVTHSRTSLGTCADVCDRPPHGHGAMS